MKRIRLAAALFALFLAPSCLLSDDDGGERRQPPVSMYGATAGAGSVGVHTVSENETLWNISQRYRLSVQGIIHANGLQAPYVLAVGQRLKLPPPREYKVKGGDTLYEVSRLFNVSVSETARTNGLRAPYTLAAGQILRLPDDSIGENESDAGQRQMPVVSPGKVWQEPLSGRPGMPEKVWQEPLAGNTPAPVFLNRPLNAPQADRLPAWKPKQDKTAITGTPPKRSGGKFKWPVNGAILSSYGPKENGLHNDGINIKAPKGTPVRAAENGVVAYAGDELQGYGNLVLVRHEGRWVTAYAHLDRVMIRRGQVVNAGETIGTVGSTGSVDTPQLHFEVRRGADALNPKLYME